MLVFFSCWFCLGALGEKYQTLNMIQRLQAQFSIRACNEDSVGVANRFYRHSHWSYQQASEYVWGKKPDIYPYARLNALLPRTLMPSC